MIVINIISADDAANVESQIDRGGSAGPFQDDLALCAGTLPLFIGSGQQRMW